MTDDNLPAGQKERKPRGPYKTSISPRTLLALEVLANGSAASLTDAARLAGLTPRAMFYAVQKPKIRDWLRNHVQATFAAGQLAASRTMMGLLRPEENPNSMSRFRAAAWICGVNGVAPVDTRGPMVAVNIGVSPGFVIDISPGTDEDPRPLPSSNVVGFAPTGPVIDGEAVDVTPRAPERDDEGDC